MLVERTRSLPCITVLDFSESLSKSSQTRLKRSSLPTHEMMLVACKSLLSSMPEASRSLTRASLSNYQRRKGTDLGLKCPRNSDNVALEALDVTFSVDIDMRYISSSISPGITSLTR